MRALIHPKVFPRAAAAAALTTFACYSRMVLWSARPDTVWFLEIVIFFTSLFFWAFVLAWHEPYTRRPLFVWKPLPHLWKGVSLCAVVAAVLTAWLIDPTLRPIVPELYPKNLMEWQAIVFFECTFAQLFLCFAPLAFVARLLPSRRSAIAATILFGVFVTYLKLRGLTVPVSLPLGAGLMALKAASMALVLAFYLEGGVLLVWWWTLLLEARHLPGLF